MFVVCFVGWLVSWLFGVRVSVYVSSCSHVNVKSLFLCWIFCFFVLQFYPCCVCVCISIWRSNEIEPNCSAWAYHVGKCAFANVLPPLLLLSFLRRGERKKANTYKYVVVDSTTVYNCVDLCTWIWIFVWLFSWIILPHKLFSRLRYDFFSDSKFFSLEFRHCDFSLIPTNFFLLSVSSMNNPWNIARVRMGWSHSNQLKWYVCFVLGSHTDISLDGNRYRVKDEKIYLLRQFEMYNSGLNGMSYKI